MEPNDTGPTDREPDSRSKESDALEHVIDPVVTVADGTVTYANDAAREAFDLAGDGEGESTLAESLGVSRPTFHEHLRNAEEKLCRAFFSDD